MARVIIFDCCLDEEGWRICHEGSAGGEAVAWGSLGMCNTSVPIDAQACESFDLLFACLSRWRLLPIIGTITACWRIWQQRTIEQAQTSRYS